MGRPEPHGREGHVGGIPRLGADGAHAGALEILAITRVLNYSVLVVQEKAEQPNFAWRKEGRPWLQLWYADQHCQGIDGALPAATVLEADTGIAKGLRGGASSYDWPRTAVSPAGQEGA